MSFSFPKRKPLVPAEIIRENILDEYSLSQDKLANLLGVSRLTINQLVNDKRSISTDMALRISKLTGTSAQFWISLQAKYDLWKAFQKSKIDLDKITPLNDPREESIESRR